MPTPPHLHRRPFTGRSPSSWETKNPRADLISLTRPLRPVLFSQFEFLSKPRRLSKTFYAGIAYPQLYQFTRYRAAVKNYFNFFLAQPGTQYQNQRPSEYPSPSPTQALFELFPLFLILHCTTPKPLVCNDLQMPRYGVRWQSAAATALSSRGMLSIRLKAGATLTSHSPYPNASNVRLGFRFSSFVILPS